MLYYINVSNAARNHRFRFVNATTIYSISIIPPGMSGGGGGGGGGGGDAALTLPRVKKEAGC
jgi:hypothetical protein